MCQVLDHEYLLLLIQVIVKTIKNKISYLQIRHNIEKTPLCNKERWTFTNVQHNIIHNYSSLKLIYNCTIIPICCCLYMFHITYQLLECALKHIWSVYIHQLCNCCTLDKCLGQCLHSIGWYIAVFQPDIKTMNCFNGLLTSSDLPQRLIFSQCYLPFLPIYFYFALYLVAFLKIHFLLNIFVFN